MLLPVGVGTVAHGLVIDPDHSQPLLDPLLQPKFVNALPNPLIPGFILTPDKTNPLYDYYEVSARQIVQQTGLVDEVTRLPLSTTFWGYGDARLGATTGLHTYPGPTFEIRSNFPSRVRWLNELPTTNLFPIDSTISCGNPAGVPCPSVAIVTHVHGAHVQGDSDGGPLGWFSPGFAQVSPFWDPNPYGLPGTYSYPNTQEAATVWYHDHAQRFTHTNVWAGLAGFYLIRDANEDALQLAGTLPKYPYEVPIAIQDRNFYANGALAIPDMPVRNLLSPLCGTMIDPVTGLPVVNPATCPVVNDPTTGLPIPSITPELFGNMMLANGLIWPKLDVEPRVYRLRLLNGCDSRTVIMKFSNGMSFYQIGTEQGFLQAPVAQTQIVLMPGERVDVLVDFKTAVAGSQVILQNIGLDAPFMGFPLDPLLVANPATTGQIMAFNVNVPLSATPDTANPATIASLRATPIAPLVATAAAPRKLALMEMVDLYGRLLLTLNGLDMMTAATELPNLNSVEIWEVANTTPDAHPIHLHLVQFQLLDRQPFNPLTFVPPVPATALTPYVQPSWTLTGVPTLPPPQEAGWKDTIQMMPGEVTRIIAKFDIAGNYVWHCHILSHEEHDMMRPLIVTTPATGVTVTANPAVPAVAGNATVTFTAEGTTNLQTLRSSGAFEYQFLVNGVVAQPYSMMQNFMWTPAAAGANTVTAQARAIGSAAAFEAQSAPLAYTTNANLIGTVINPATGLPVLGATVTVNPGALTAMTDAMGNYAFAVAAGAYTVTTAAPGLGTATLPATVAAGVVTNVQLPITTAANGVLTGTITNAVGGLPVAGVVVTANPVPAPVAGTPAITAITNANGVYSIAVPPGSYTITTTALGFVNTTTVAATAVTAGATAAPVNAALAAGVNGTVTGVITNPVTALPVVGATVTLTPGGFTGVTNATGAYTITAPAGTYTVNATALGFTAAPGTAVVAAAGAVAVNVTVTAAVNGTLTGQIVSAATGLPAAGITVVANPGGFTAITAATGIYSIPVPPGTYTVTTTTLGFANATTAAPVVIAAGATATAGVTTITAAANAVLTGVITDAATGLPVAGVTVTTAPGGFTAVTSATGTYTIVVPVGVYHLTTTALGFANTATATPVSVTAGQISTPINTALTAAVNGTVTGIITNPATGLPVAGAVVTLTPGGFTGTTTATGAYSIIAPAGTYTVNATALGFTAVPATTIVAAGGAAAVNVTVTAAVNGTVTGTITAAATGLPVAGVTVTANPGGFTAITDALGNYIITVPPGTFTLTTTALGFANATSAAPVTVAAGGTAPAGVTAIAAGANATLTGVITNAATGLPAAGVTVTTTPGGFTAVTTATGAYSIIVPPGSYTVTTAALGLAATTTATPVAVGAGQVSTPINVALTAGVNGTVTGIITDPVTGLPVAGAVVTLTPGGFVGTTTATGAYTIAAPAGTYTVTVSALGFTAPPATATVTAGAVATTANITVTAAANGTLTGQIIDAATGLPAAGVTVTTNPGGFTAVTDAAGNYIITVPPGTYTVTSTALGLASATTATPVTVAAGGTAAAGASAVTVATNATITGTVIDPVTGLPVPGVTVTVNPGGFTAVTDAAGVYTVTVPAGTYTVTSASGVAGAPTVSAGAVVEAGGTATADLEIEAAPTGGGDSSSNNSGWCFISSLGFSPDESESTAPLALGFLAMVFALAMALRARERNI
jgi:spore coat protein A